MRKTRLVVVLGAALTLAHVATASAQPPPLGAPEGAGPGGGRVTGMARALRLSEAQEQQVRALVEDRRAEHEALREQMRSNSEQLEKALESASPDPAGVGVLAIEGHRLREQGRALREAQDKAVRAILTPEQQVRWDAIVALREEHGPFGFGPPRGHRGMAPPAQP